MPVRPSSGRSAELSHDSATRVAAHENIRCRRDYIVVEPLKVDHRVPFMVIERTKPLRGIVKAVGPGHYPKRYDHPDKHVRTKTWDSRTFQPTEVKVGDVVELGGYEYGGYAFQTFMWGDVLHVICREADVSGIVEPEEIPGLNGPPKYRKPLAIDFFRTEASLIDALVGPGLL